MPKYSNIKHTVHENKPEMRKKCQSIKSLAVGNTAPGVPNTASKVPEV